VKYEIARKIREMWQPASHLG